MAQRAPRRGGSSGGLKSDPIHLFRKGIVNSNVPIVDTLVLDWAEYFLLPQPALITSNTASNARTSCKDPVHHAPVSAP